MKLKDILEQYYMTDMFGDNYNLLQIVKRSIDMDVGSFFSTYGNMEFKNKKEGFCSLDSNAKMPPISKFHYEIIEMRHKMNDTKNPHEKIIKKDSLIVYYDEHLNRYEFLALDDFDINTIHIDDVHISMLKPSYETIKNIVNYLFSNNYIKPTSKVYFDNSNRYEFVYQTNRINPSIGIYFIPKGYDILETIKNSLPFYKIPRSW